MDGPFRLSKTIMEPPKPYQKFKYHCYLCTHNKVSIQGVVAVWGDYMAIPADQGF